MLMLFIAEVQKLLLKLFESKEKNTVINQLSKFKNR
jgi:hypothetical protein